MAHRDLSVASFNLYNLQLADELWRGKRYTQDEYQAKLAWSKDAFLRLDADIVAFQELWSPKCLSDILEAAGASDDYQPIFIDESWYDIAVAAVVRKPWKLGTKTIHKAFPDECVIKKRKKQGSRDDREDDEVDVRIDRFSRSVLELSLEHPDDSVPDLRVFAAHLKSKLPTRLDQEESDQPEVRKHSSALGSALSTIRRTAEAAALSVLLKNATHQTDTPVICVGDLNDGLESNTLNILSGQPTMRQRMKSRTGSRSDAGLYSAAYLQMLHSLRDMSYSHDHDGILETLDHVLVSEQFYDHSKKRVWSLRRFDILNDHISDSNPATTDHGLAIARFDYNPCDD